MCLLKLLIYFCSFLPSCFALDICSTFLFLCEMDLFPLPDYLNQAVQGWPEFIPHKAALVAQTIKNLSAIQETQV